MDENLCTGFKPNPAKPGSIKRLNFEIDFKLYYSYNREINFLKTEDQMLVFDKAIIKKYWPADDKGEDDELVRQLVIQADVELDNSLQVGELFNNMIRGLVRILILDNVTGEEYVLPAVTIKPFNVKQKKVKIGKGEDADIVKSEYAALTLVSRIQDNKGGDLLAELYRFFNIDVRMTIEKFIVPGEESSAKVEDEDEM